MAFDGVRLNLMNEAATWLVTGRRFFAIGDYVAARTHLANAMDALVQLISLMDTTLKDDERCEMRDLAREIMAVQSQLADIRMPDK